MISSDIIRGYNDVMILHILRKGDSYGYEIQKQIRTIAEEKYIIKETTLYSAFTRLEKKGHIEAYPGEQTLGKRRTYYRITPEGNAFYVEKCREWALTKEVVSKFIEEEYTDGDH